jgi:HEAT repeat protein
MNMFVIIADSIIWLTLVVIALSVIAVLNRYVSDIRQARIRARRMRMKRSVDDFLGKVIGVETAGQELGKDREVALGVLIEAASQLTKDGRDPLKPLFDHFQYAEKEIAALKNGQWAVRARAASRLGYMNHAAAIEPLMYALDDESLDVRLAAAHALAQMGATQAVPAILRALALPAAWPLQRCAEILHEMGSDAADPLLRFLKTAEPAQNSAAMQVAVRVLGMLREGRAVVPLSGFLQGPNTELRLASTKALGEIGDLQVTGAMMTLLADPAWEVRSAAALALGQLGHPTAVYELNQALADSAWWVRFNAASSLFRLGKEGRAALEANSARHRDAFARDICRQVLEECAAPASAGGLNR